MDILDVDVSKMKFDVALLKKDHTKHGVFANNEAGFKHLWSWLEKHRSSAADGIHVCLEATGNWGLDLADFLHMKGVKVSVVNPARVKA
ncbi:transposase [Acidisoma cellulosilytica]|uniref:Transposase n=1 Tax=Acidisoma cellulosilyticum TaxID=2802395 RepID=A0A963Z8R4_9PROT|nr:transposase [Acidisoma cellulosilyticum]